MNIKQIQTAAVLLLGLLFNTSVLRARPLPNSPNTMLEATGPGLSRSERPIGSPQERGTSRGL